MPVMPVMEVPEEGDETRREYDGGTFDSKKPNLQISIMSPTSAGTRERYEAISSKLYNLPKNWR